MSAIDVVAVAVTYNSAAELPGFIESLRSAAVGLTLHITVVDNDSSDDSVAVARSLGVQCVRSPVNRGYAAGINLGREAAPTGYEALLIANPDVRFSPGSVGSLYREAIATGDVTVPRLVDARGRVHRSLRREPTLGRVAGEALFGDHWPQRPAALSMIIRDPRAYDGPEQVDWATGAVMMMPVVCDHAVGLWREDYFLYSEETDYCSRVRLAGHAIRYTPDATVCHSEGASGHGGVLVALDAVNQVRYYRLRHGIGKSTAYALFVLLDKILRSHSRPHRMAARSMWNTGLRGAITGRFPDGQALYEQLSDDN